MCYLKISFKKAVSSSHFIHSFFSLAIYVYQHDTVVSFQWSKQASEQKKRRKNRADE
jgi:hypothetical protein